MHEINFLETSKERVVDIVKVEYKDDHVTAILVTEQFGRRTRKPFIFTVDEWERIRKRGYVE